MNVKLNTKIKGRFLDFLDSLYILKIHIVLIFIILHIFTSFNSLYVKKSLSSHPYNNFFLHFVFLKAVNASYTFDFLD